MFVAFCFHKKMRQKTISADQTPLMHRLDGAGHNKTNEMKILQPLKSIKISAYNRMSAILDFHKKIHQIQGSHSNVCSLRLGQKVQLKTTINLYWLKDLRQLDWCSWGQKFRVRKIRKLWNSNKSGQLLQCLQASIGTKGTTEWRYEKQETWKSIWINEVIRLFAV